MADRTITLLEADDRRWLADYLTGVLVDAATHRSERDGWDTSPDGEPELAWITFERGQMLAAVNQLRRGRGLPPVAAVDLLPVERSAQGHSDYARQYAFGCAELVLGLCRPQMT